MAEIRRCPECGAELASNAPEGLCPKCLLAAGLEETGAEQAPAADAATIVPSDDEWSSSPLGTKVRYFGDYELLEEIARGGMGVVYKARQTSLNRVVALKMILAGQLASEEDVRRFHTEAEAAAGLQHTNIVAVHEVGRHEGQHFFSMDYVEGRSLADTIGQRPLAPKKAAEYLKTLAEAIHYAHEQGIVHRDLKPSNVLIDDSDQPRITDFGLARKIEGDSQLTATGTVLGTPGYMAPEQAAANPHQIGRTTDVYSLGAVFYALLVGRPPFLAASLLDTLNQVREQEPAAPRSLNSLIPPDLETICLKCLEKRPDGRYQTAQELADDLGRFLRQEPIQAQPADTVRRLWSRAKQRPWAFAAVASMLLAGSLGAAYYWWAENSFLKWVASHPDYEKIPGPHTAEFIFSVYVCVGLSVCLAVAWSIMKTVFGKGRSLSLVGLHSREYKLRRQSFPTSLLRLYGLLGVSCIAFGMYAITNAIDAHIWENDVSFRVWLAISVFVLGILAAFNTAFHGSFLLVYIWSYIVPHLAMSGSRVARWLMICLSLSLLFFSIVAVWGACWWFVFTESSGSLMWCVKNVMGDGGSGEVTLADIFMRWDTIMLLAVWGCIETGRTLLIDVLREYESGTFGFGTTLSSALSEIELKKIRTLLLDGQKSAAISAYGIATDVPPNEAQNAIGDFEIQLFRKHPDKAPVGRAFGCSMSLAMLALALSPLWMMQLAAYSPSGAAYSPSGAITAVVGLVTAWGTLFVCSISNWERDRVLNLILILLVIGALFSAILPIPGSGIVIGWIIGVCLGFGSTRIVQLLSLGNRAMNAEPNPYAPEDRRHYLYNSFTQYGSANAGQLNDHVAVDVAPGIKPVIVTRVPNDGSGLSESAEEGRGEFNVVLTGLWNSKVRVIEAVRSITNLNLKEATELVEGVPRLLKERVSKDEAEQLKAEMEAAGGFCEIK